MTSRIVLGGLLLDPGFWVDLGIVLTESKTQQRQEVSSHFRESQHTTAQWHEW